MPTPAAVLEGARLLAEGTPGSAGLGDAAGGRSRRRDDRRALGLQRATPTPAGDRAVRPAGAESSSAPSRATSACATTRAPSSRRRGVAAIAAEAGLAEARRRRRCSATLPADVERLPANARGAALRPRAGPRRGAASPCAAMPAPSRPCYTVTGPVTVQRGKDLSDVERRDRHRRPAGAQPPIPRRS